MEPWRGDWAIKLKLDGLLKDLESLFIYLLCRKLRTLRSRPAADPESAYVRLEIPTPTHCYLSVTQFMKFCYHIQEKPRLRIVTERNKELLKLVPKHAR